MGSSIQFGGFAIGSPALIASTPEVFEGMISQGENIMYMDADELKECIVEAEVCIYE